MQPDKYLMRYDPDTGVIVGFDPYDAAEAVTDGPQNCIVITARLWTLLLQGLCQYRLKLPVSSTDPLDALAAFDPYIAPEPDPRTPQEIIMDELASLDSKLPRAVEDLIEVLQVPVISLPEIMQERLRRKQELRTALQQYI